MTIKVNSVEWNALETDQQDLISTIIANAFPGQTIEPAAGGVSVDSVGGFCTLACDLAQSAAVALCGSLGSGKEICVIAAKAAGDFCRSKC